MSRKIGINENEYSSCTLDLHLSRSLLVYEAEQEQYLKPCGEGKSTLRKGLILLRHSPFPQSRFINKLKIFHFKKAKNFTPPPQHGVVSPSDGI